VTTPTNAAGQFPALNGEHDSNLLRELASTAASLSAYLQQRRVLEERLWTRSIATTVFFVSLVVSCVITNALTNRPHDTEKKQMRVGVLKVDSQARPEAKPSTEL